MIKLFNSSALSNSIAVQEGVEKIVVHPRKFEFLVLLFHLNLFDFMFMWHSKAIQASKSEAFFYSFINYSSHEKVSKKSKIVVQSAKTSFCCLSRHKLSTRRPTTVCQKEPKEYMKELQEFLEQILYLSYFGKW